MKVFFILFLNLFLIFTSCTKKETGKITLSKGTKETTPIVKNIDDNRKKIEEAKATIKAKKKKKEKIMLITLKTGTVKIKLRPDLAPKHVQRITTLTNEGFYNGLKFHRVIKGFMAQTGDPAGNGTGGSKLPNLESEFTSTPFNRGVLGMARSTSPHSANSQFFIMLAEASHLNNTYTAFGEVVSGMEHIDQIKLGDGPNGSVSNPDTMIKVTVQ